MLAVVSWHCDCGMSVKAMYETNGLTHVRCPKPGCKKVHPVQGKISELWTKDGTTVWQSHADVKSLVV